MHISWGDKMELEENVRRAIIEVAKQYPNIDKIVLFGSRARGDHHKTSDIDLAIWATDSLCEFAYTIDEQVPTLLEFDLSDMKEVDDLVFVEQVLKEGILLYEKSRF